jgi:2,3-bisphosphoglycerate-dependent phosphoglycerate mutase
MNYQNNNLTQLLLARHGESTFNRDNLFTGWIDAPLTEKGREEVKEIARKLNGHSFDIAYTSKLRRAIETLHIVLNEIHAIEIPIIESEKLNERHYGDLQGLNKEETALQYGREQVNLWRRSYAAAPPNGESLKDTTDRVLPFFRSTIMNDIAKGKNVLVIAHGNSLRAIVKKLDHLSDSEITDLNIATGEVIVYFFNKSMFITGKTIL